MHPLPTLIAPQCPGRWPQRGPLRPDGRACVQGPAGVHAAFLHLRLPARPAATRRGPLRASAPAAGPQPSISRFPTHP